MGNYIRDSEEQKKKRSLEDFQKTLVEYELIKLALTDENIRIDNVEKLVRTQFSSCIPTLKQILTELEREERQRPTRKGQMRRTGRNQ